MNLTDKISKFLRRKDLKLCVIATSTKDGKSECAVMGYSILNDLTVVLCTDKTSRKWKNLKENPKLSLTFGWSFDTPNIQYDGICELVENGAELETCEKTYFLSHPEAEEFKDLPETVYIKATPKWVRLTDYSTNPERFEEKEF